MGGYPYASLTSASKRPEIDSASSRRQGLRPIAAWNPNSDRRSGKAETMMKIPYSKQREILSSLKCTAILIGLAITAPFASQSTAQEPQGIPLLLVKGAVADYGATPWYTPDVVPGKSPMKFALDTGAAFTWATSDLCETLACYAHENVDTSQPGFVWVDKTRQKRSFGPWGDMYTQTGRIPFSVAESVAANTQFFASVDYEGAKFQYLAWGGGVGFPSRSDQVVSGSGFLFQELWEQKILANPMFTTLTDRASERGFFNLGSPLPELFYDKETQIRLEPKSAAIRYLWGTELHSASLGSQALPSLTGSTFFLDTGSSRFKGDSQYIIPILEILLDFKDSSGSPVFQKIMEDSQWVGLSYIEGGPEDYPLLPNLLLTIGQSCYGEDGQAALIGLGPAQYSYQVEEGDRSGQWVIAAHVLPGVGGLLVGSTFMDLLAAEFTYQVEGTSSLEQGNMYLYQKVLGEGPNVFGCRS